MRRGVVGAVALGVGCAVGGPASAQQIEADGVQLRLTGRLHVQFSTSSVTDAEAGENVATTAFETRRARLGAALTIDEWITGIIEPEFASGNVELRNAWMNLAFSEAFEVRFGHFKKPFSRLRLTSSTVYPTIERGVRIRGLADALEGADDAADDQVLTTFMGSPLIGEEQDLLEELGYIDYDVGAAVHGRLGRFTYEAGVFNGVNADAADTNDGKSLAARVVWAVEDVPLELGAGVAYHQVGEPEVDGTAWEIDAEWGGFRVPGLHVLGEFAVGSNIATSSAFAGAQAIMSVFRPLSDGRVDGYELVGRASWGDPNDEVDGDAGLLLTPGVNLYLFGRNMLMLNWDVYMPEGEQFETHYSVRAQARFHF